MKKAFIYGIAAWFASLILMALLAPILFHGRDMNAIGQVWFPISFFVIGIPAFVLGLLKSLNKPALPRAKLRPTRILERYNLDF